MKEFQRHWLGAGLFCSLLMAVRSGSRPRGLPLGMEFCPALPFCLHVITGTASLQSCELILPVPYRSLTPRYSVTAAYGVFTKLVLVLSRGTESVENICIILQGVHQASRPGVEESTWLSKGSEGEDSTRLALCWRVLSPGTRSCRTRGMEARSCLGWLRKLEPAVSRPRCTFQVDPALRSLCPARPQLVGWCSCREGNSQPAGHLVGVHVL